MVEVDVALDVRKGIGGHRGIDATWADEVHANSIGGEFYGKSLHEHDESGF